MKYLLFAIFYIVAIPAYSENMWHSSTVKTVYPQGNGGFIILFDSPSSDCSRSDKYHYVMANQNGMTQDGIKNILSVVLTAATLDKEISVYFDKDSDGCYVNRLRLEF